MDHRTGGSLRLAAALGLLVGMAAAAARADDKPAEYVGATQCLSCHGETHAAFKDNLHVQAMRNAKGLEFEKTCETCHGPGSRHAAAGGDKNDPGFATIMNPAKLKGVDASNVCLQCHEGGARMHWKGSTHDMKNVGCVNCHSMHDAKINNGRAPLLKTSSVVETCYQCHAEKKAQIRKSAHMPIVEGKMGCSSCHNPHGSAADKLLAKKSVPETCYQCHQDKRGPFMWTHPPVQENCATCHDPHGSHHDKMLVTRAPLLCQRCHIGTRHPATLYDQTAANAQGNRLFNKSCANCHSNLHGSNHPSGKFFLR